MDEEKYCCPKCGDILILIDSIKYVNTLDNTTSYDDIFSCKTCSYKEVKLWHQY